MQIHELSSWSEFGAKVDELDRKRDRLQRASTGDFDLLFRGLGNRKLRLETTLERAPPLEAAHNTETLNEYYREVYASRTFIETLTDRVWEGLPEPLEFDARLDSFKTLIPQLFFSREVSIYSFFVYLRHHGFPSPLLDWTASPFVAAFFAFDSMQKDAEFVSIYAILRDSSSSSSMFAPRITILGPYVRSHRRHLIQQSQYSMCLQWNPDFALRPHTAVMDEKGAFGFQGEAVRLDIPSGDRVVALKSLDLMNINSFSLFGSEDSLIRTIARRRFLLGRRAY